MGDKIDIHQRFGDPYLWRQLYKSSVLCVTGSDFSNILPSEYWVDVNLAVS